MKAFNKNSVSSKEEVRCYGESGSLRRFGFFLLIYPIVMTLVAIFNGRFWNVLWLIILICFLILLFWLGSRWGTYVAVNKKKKTLLAFTFFIKAKEINISSITDIRTCRIYAGAATIIEIKYQDRRGIEKAVGFSTTNFLDKNALKKILSAIISVNSSVYITPDLLM
jgi:hypothetical protein